jgi:hypothetical protein
MTHAARPEENVRETPSGCVRTLILTEQQCFTHDAKETIGGRSGRTAGEGDPSRNSATNASRLSTREVPMLIRSSSGRRSGSVRSSTTPAGFGLMAPHQGAAPPKRRLGDLRLLRGYPRRTLAESKTALLELLVQRQRISFVPWRVRELRIPNTLKRWLPPCVSAFSFRPTASRVD